MNEGWIKLHRQLKEWQHYQEPFVLLVWLDLLLSANMKAGWVRGNRINRGQLITSVARIMESTGIGSDNTVRDALRKLEESGEIKREQIGIGTKITINHFNKFQTSAQDAQPSAQHTAEVGAQPTAEVGAYPSAEVGADKQEYKKEEKDKNLRKKEDEEDNARGMSSVVVGLVDFLSNWWDVNLTPAQVALIDSKPADYWESFKDEIEASKWLKQQDLGKVFALHRNVVDGQYRTFKETTPPPVPTYTPPKEPEFTPREQAIIDNFNAWRKDNPDLRGVYEYLKQLAEKHGGIPDKVCRALGMIYYANSWHFK